MSDPVELRDEVRWFAEQMELRLRANDHKGGWQDEDPLWLWANIHHEELELHHALYLNPPVDRQAVIREAADVANFAMMVADWHRWEVLGVRREWLSPHPPPARSRTAPTGGRHGGP